MGLLEQLQEKLPQYRFHALALAAFAALALSLLHLGPGFLTVVSFFWPLLLSTAFLLAAVLVLRFISPPPAEVQSNQTGEEFMDYVASPSLSEHRPDAEGSSGEDRHEQEVEEEDEQTTAAAGEQGAGGAAAAAEAKKKSQ